MRCMITANRRARATIAFFIPPVALWLVLRFGIGTVVSSIMGFEDKLEFPTRRSSGLSDDRVQADMRSHLIHRPARDIIPPLGGARLSSYRIWFCAVFMLLPRLVPGSTGTRRRQPRCGA